MAQFPLLKLFAPILAGSEAIISPSRYFLGRGFHLKSVTPGVYSLKHVVPVNSGMLIDAAAFQTSGGYKEDVRLDFSDFKFIERFKKHYSSFAVIDLHCEQDFSGDKHSDLELTRRRYAFYCEGARNSIEGLTDWLVFPAVALARGLKLAWDFKSTSFFKVYLQYFF